MGKRWEWRETVPLNYTQHRLAEAIEPVSQALALHGLSLPIDPHEQECMFLADVALIDSKLGGLQNLSELLYLPECVDVMQRNIIKLYVDFPSPPFFNSPSSFLIVDL